MIQNKRGIKATIPTGGDGEILVTTDTKEIFFGMGGTNVQIATMSAVNQLLYNLTDKAAVRAATTANIALTGLQTIDGVSLNAGDRVLVKNQTNQPDNGIYIVNAAAWTRATDAATGAELVGASVFVDEGTVNADRQYMQTAISPITIGTTNIVWIINPNNVDGGTW